MRNYIILNDINSNTINGLLIQELPPISKPKMRTRTEEIDGRAGDIVTQLGFKAYDKTIKIGLYGDFDINEVISYFNSSGQVVFSNEPDKYYNYQIVDQIDYERLIRFRTAKVKMHVQPFKYPTEEEPLVGQYQYVTNTGSNMSLDNTANALFKKFDLKGNTSQNGTPTPSSPIPVNVVSGDNEINICGKNLLDNSKIVKGRLDNGVIGYESGTTSLTYDNDSFSFTTNANYRGCVSDYINRVASDYVFNSNTLNSTYSLAVACYDENKTWLSNAYVNVESGGTKRTFSISDATKYIRLYFSLTTAGTITINNPMLEKGSTVSTYEPYMGNTYPIYLGVENLYKESEATLGTISQSDGTTISSSTSVYYTPSYIGILPNTKYSFKYNGTSNITIRVFYYSNTRTYLGTAVVSGSSSNETTFTTNASAYFIRLQFGSGFYNQNLQFTKGEKIQYISTTPIELCKIGNYVDFIFPAINGNSYYDSLTQAQKNELIYGSWYLHKEIGKVVLDGSESWNLGTTQTPNYSYYFSGTYDTLIGYSDYRMYSNYFGIPSQKITPAYVATGSCISGTNTNEAFRTRVLIPSDVASSVATFKTWLSTNKPSIYYVLATPTTTEITDTTLISQLEALKLATSYEGQTNISHDSNDAPFLVDVSAVQSGTDELVVDNEGNIYSRPTLDLEGTGIVNVYLEGNQMFQVDLTDTNEIVIDTDKMEAYNPTTQALMNRQVTGNYDNFKLNVGDNTLKFSGDLTKATVTNYVRWL